jgi:peptide/nickel transport system ATP-binding protein
MRKQPLLAIQSLCAHHRDRQVLHDVVLDIHPGQSIGLIGESGSGKSLTALACLGLLPDGIHCIGSIRYQDVELMQLDEAGWQDIRGKKIGIVFQDPMTSLNPIMTLGAQILETLKRVEGESAADRRARATRLLEEVGLPNPAAMLKRYPFEISGGQQQRAMIAMTLAAEPELLIADEPTTALDVTTQAQILTLLRDIQRRRNMAMLFISHDLDVVSAMSDHVAVMYGGQLVEQGSTDKLLKSPRHPYTQSLLRAHAELSVSRRNMPPPGDTIVEIDELCVDYGRFRPKRALDKVSLRLRAGTTLGIAGESGSGKTTLAQTIMGLLTPSEGRIQVFGKNPSDKRARRDFARQCQYVFQDTTGSLNPRRTIMQALAEPLLAQDKTLAEGELHSRCAAMLEEVGMDPALLSRFPHQVSGGQRQRVVIARALAMNPRLLVCDEPVSALDATVRNQVLALLAKLRKERDLTLIFIGHDLNVMESMVDEVLVMQRGKIVEHGAAKEVFSSPRQDYTRELLQAGRLSSALRLTQ